MAALKAALDLCLVAKCLALKMGEGKSVTIKENGKGMKKDQELSKEKAKRWWLKDKTRQAVEHRRSQ